MSIVLHGEDIQNSYLELQNTLRQYQNLQKLRLSSENDQSINVALFSIDMFEAKKVVIGEDLIASKKVDPKSLTTIPEGNIVIFWEKKELPASTLKLFPQGTTIKLFKANPVLFKFLDSIGSRNAVQQGLLDKLENTKVALTWQIENRLFLLILLKLGYSAKRISEITKKPMQDWQFEKLQTQARNLNLNLLKKLFSSTLKIETLIKSGLTNQAEKNLISLMLLKHFAN